MKQDTRQLLRQLPKVDVLLQRPALAEWEQNLSRSLIKQAVQDVLAGLRRDILAERRRDVPAEDELDGMVLAYFRRQKSLRLKKVVNATGTILHTNLGRSVLSEEIGRHVGEIAASYSNLEYDLDEGRRGSRYAHLQSLLKELTGAEDVLVVNNNAAAVLLALTSMTQGKEVVISRGELVEIGGLFRIPDVIEASGGTIREVGTTNKTHLADYSRAVGEGTGAIMKVHTSNYRIIGFSESVPAQELAELAHANGLPLINDLGSGLFVDMRRFGLPYEPTVKEVLKQGCDVVMFSGDKLLGGPQAGIIVGKAEYIEPMKQPICWPKCCGLPTRPCRCRPCRSATWSAAVPIRNIRCRGTPPPSRQKAGRRQNWNAACAMPKSPSSPECSKTGCVCPSERCGTTNFP